MDKAIISYMRIGYFRIGVIKLVFDEIKDQFEKCARACPVKSEASTFG